MRSLAVGSGFGRVVFAAVLALAALMPLAVRADTDLVIGGVAVVSDADGDDVRLRASPGVDGAIVDLVPEWSEVDVLDGPFAASDGSLWYEVAVFGQSGYMIADYLSTAGFAPAGGSTTTLSELNLRAGPSTDDAVLAVMPAGASVGFTGETSGGFAQVVYGEVAGWAFATFLSGGGVPAPSGTAVATDFLNLRAGPTFSDAILLVIPSGGTVELTGEAGDGYLSVSYEGTAGWASAEFLDAGGSAPPAPSGLAVTTDFLNLRSGPGTGFGVLDVMPFGTSIETTGSPQAGFYPVMFAGLDGWAAADFLDFDGSAVGGSRIAWPFGGGAQWYISQGYNGSSHYNSGGVYQYHYSFDLARRDGATAGEPIYSPVSGTIRWIDPASGGMSINLGDGYAVAFFHVTLAPGLSDGQRITQGDYVGYVSGPGGQGFAAFPHIHLTVWQTNDGGNWSRVAVPFTGINAIEGQQFPDVGGTNQHGGTDVG